MVSLPNTKISTEKMCVLGDDLKFLEGFGLLLGAGF